MDRDQYLDKEAPQEQEVLPADYQRALDEDPEYKEWLDECERPL